MDDVTLLSTELTFKCIKVTFQLFVYSKHMTYAISHVTNELVGLGIPDEYPVNFSSVRDHAAIGSRLIKVNTVTVKQTRFTLSNYS